jgi:hypothetical protein
LAKDLDLQAPDEPLLLQLLKQHQGKSATPVAAHVPLTSMPRPQSPSVNRKMILSDTTPSGSPVHASAAATNIDLLPTSMEKSPTSPSATTVLVSNASSSFVSDQEKTPRTEVKSELPPVKVPFLSSPDKKAGFLPPISRQPSATAATAFGAAEPVQPEPVSAAQEAEKLTAATSIERLIASLPDEVDEGTTGHDDIPEEIVFDDAGSSLHDDGDPDRSIANTSPPRQLNLKLDVDDNDLNLDEITFDDFGAHDLPDGDVKATDEFWN